MTNKQKQKSQFIYYRPGGQTRPPVSRQKQPKRHYGWFIAIVVLGLTGFLLTRSEGHALSTYEEVRSGISGYCLDNLHNKTISGNEVDIWKCNKSPAQNWNLSGNTISIDGSYCLAVDKQHAIIANCSSTAPTQVWLEDGSGLLNPDSGKCLNAAGHNDGSPVTIAACSSSDNLSWTAVSSSGKTITLPGTCHGSEGQKVACYAEQEWANWQSGVYSHPALLTSYTDGAAYEEWCADFVSYIYKEAGYPFSGGETNGWDENNANNIQNVGFTIHQPDNYTPKPGDVGYFSYNGGHVEIVVSGGPHPTFIYGDSHVTDPTTNNGDMAANTMLSDGSAGELIYYMSPTAGS